MLQYLWTKPLWYIANLGDLRVALPIAAILFAWLCARGRWRTGVWGAVAVIGCMAAMFLIKLGFFTGHLRLPALGLENPSGHGAIGAVVYGSLAWVVAREMAGWRGLALLVLGCAGVAAIGASLYVLGAHTLPDVLAGLVLGGACAAAFARLGWRDEAPRRGSPVRLILVIAIAALSLQGLHLVTRLAPTNLLMFRPALTAPA